MQGSDWQADSMLTSRFKLTEDIAAARSQVKGAEAQLVEAQKTFARAETLVSKKLAGAAELDGARAKRDSAQANLDKSHENLLLLTNGTREEDLQQAEAQVALARIGQTRIHSLLRHVEERSNGHASVLPGSSDSKASMASASSRRLA